MVKIFPDYNGFRGCSPGLSFREYDFFRHGRHQILFSARLREVFGVHQNISLLMLFLIMMAGIWRWLRILMLIVN